MYADDSSVWIAASYTVDCLRILFHRDDHLDHLDHFEI